MSGRILKFDDSAQRAAEAVLPWFVNGTLDGDELAAVEQHLRECARCRREIDWLRELQGVCAVETPEEAATAHTDATASYRRLRDRIDRPWPREALAQRLGRVLQAWQRTTSWAKWAIAVEFGAIVALAVVLAPGGEDPAVYRTLGATPVRATPASTLAVMFDEKATESDLRRILRAAGARIIEGPTEANAYVLEVPPERRDAALAALRAESAVVLAEPLAAGPKP